MRLVVEAVGYIALTACQIPRMRCVVQAIRDIALTFGQVPGMRLVVEAVFKVALLIALFVQMLSQLTLPEVSRVSVIDLVNQAITQRTAKRIGRDAGEVQLTLAIDRHANALLQHPGHDSLTEVDGGRVGIQRLV
jgi:tetrahydromethanopterin S-methyltransferase subunit G